MITEDYVSFETAKLLKEKGFDAECDYLYADGELLRAQGFTCNWNNGETLFADYKNECSAPTLQMAMKWLREVHNIHIEVNLSFSEDPIKYPTFYYVYILDSKSGNSIIKPAARIDGLNPLVDVDNVPRNFNTYEQACEAAIKYCLENLI